MVLSVGKEADKLLLKHSSGQCFDLFLISTCISSTERDGISNLGEREFVSLSENRSPTYGVVLWSLTEV